MQKVKRALFFLYTLFCIAFPLGTFTLVFIVESYTAYSRSTGWMLEHENLAVSIIILLYLIYSVAIAIWVYQLLRAASKKTIITTLSLLTILTSLCLVYWFNPNLHSNQSTIATSTDGRFSIGPYPDKQKMIALKKQGYTAIISLLSPYILPFEPVLLNNEIKHADDVGIRIINIPMVPWITDNHEAIEKIKALATSNHNEKYYVHCYYGRDRANMFLRIGGITLPKEKENEKSPLSNPLYVLETSTGLGVILNSQLFLAPRLSNEKFASYVIKHKPDLFDKPINWVISLEVSGYQPLDTEKELAKYNLKLTRITVHNYPYKPEELLDFANTLKTHDGSVLVYAYRYNPDELTLVQDGILMSYFTGLPSLPRQLFDKSPMSNGKTTMIAPNIVLGPTPTKKELDSYLYTIGVRRFAYIGSCDDSDYLTDKKSIAFKTSSFYCFQEQSPELLSTLAQDGPWYVYGPGSENERERLMKAFGHLLPNLTKEKRHQE